MLLKLQGFEFKSMEAKPEFVSFCFNDSMCSLCSALNFPKGDWSWFLKCGVCGYLTLIFALKQNGSN